MAKRRKKKRNTFKDLVSIAAALAGAILTIVGICTEWVKCKTESIIINTTSSLKLSELSDGDGYTIMCILAYAVIALSVISCALIAVRSFSRGIPSACEALCGVLSVICAIALLIVTIVFCSNNVNISLGSLANVKLVISLGAILSVVGGVLSGIAALLHGRK